jgi:hypothetical protein
MDAEQVRDSIMYVSGNLDKSSYGPSQDLTPANLRRTVYGKVSRYKLDTYLQLFDFPSPSISAEKRFTTTVPLQRLFLMNSDFSQIEAEELSKRIAAEPNNRARIKKAYNLVYMRDPSEQEITLGLEYLSSEPMKEYDELKAKEKEKPANPGRGGRGAGAVTSKVEKPESAPAAEGSGIPVATEAKPAAKEEAKAEAKEEVTAKAEAKPEAEAKADDAKPMPLEAANADAAAGGQADMDMGNGMMGGVNGRRGGRAGAAEIKYEPTVWGRYMKVLLSSSEFLFIN